MLLLPLRVFTDTTPPGLRPYSAEYGLVITLNCEITSTDGCDASVLSSCTFSEKVLLSIPSRMKLFCSEWTPFTLKSPVRPADVAPLWLVYRAICTPGITRKRSSQLRR